MIKKYLHTRLRVSDMGKSLHFYHKILGLEIQESKTSPRGSKLVFLKLPGTDSEIELCSFPDSGKVELPEDLVHLAFEVGDLEKTMTYLKQNSIPITEGPVKSERGSTFIFTEDPDKYEIELIQYPKLRKTGDRKRKRLPAGP